MSKEDFVSSHKKQKNKGDKDMSKPEFIQGSFFDIKDDFFVQKIKNSKIEMHAMDVSEYLKQIKEPIHLIVTSPPYNCNIKYDLHSDNLDWKEYEKWQKDIFTKLYNLLVEGGRVVINFPLFVKIKDTRTSLNSLFERILIGAGFDIIDYVVWVKARDEKEAMGVAGRSTAWGSWLSPSSPNIRPICELIIVAKKPGKFKIEKERIDIDKEEFKRYTTSAWFVQSRGSKHHPAIFPSEIPYRSIKLYSHKGDNILDPFMGIGSTAIAAIKSSRNFFGVDISKDYLRAAASRVQSV